MQGSLISMTAASVNQFPQPTRPLNSYDMSYELPSTAYPHILENSTSSNVPHREDNIVDSNIHVTMAKEKERERKYELVEKIVDKVVDKYEKLSHMEDMLAKERNREGKSQSTTSRGLQQPVEAGEKEKLERFKIRTVVAEEVVVKEDEKK